MSRKSGGSLQREGALQRNNIYSSDAVRDWADRIHCGVGGIQMNEKFMLVGLSKSCNPRGVCELPVRYLADYIGVGMRQAQRILKQLINYELVYADEVPSQGRPNDIVRKFTLNTTLDPDTFEPKSSTQLPLMRRFRDAVKSRLHQMNAKNELGDMGLLELCSVHFVLIHSKRLDFVSPDSDTTNRVFYHEKLFLDLASEFSNSTVTKLHMIPKKGYRG